MLIWKQTLPHETTTNVSCNLPFKSVVDLKAHVLKIDIQFGIPTMWYQADDDDTGKIKNKTEYILTCIKTGQQQTDPTSRKFYNQNTYIGTLLLNEGDTVLHYFAISKIDYNNQKQKLASSPFSKGETL